MAVALCLVREEKRLVVVVISSNVGNLGEVFQATVVNSQGDYQAEEFSKANVGGCKPSTFAVWGGIGRDFLLSKS